MKESKVHILIIQISYYLNLVVLVSQYNQSIENCSLLHFTEYTCIEGKAPLYHAINIHFTSE